MAALSPNHRPGCARLGMGRLKAFRLNVYESVMHSHIDGLPPQTGPGTGLLIEGAAIEHVLNDQVDTAQFRARGVAPLAGQSVSVWDGDWTTPHAKLFGGPIIETTVGYEERTENVVTDLRCIDPTWLMQRRLAIYTYRNAWVVDIIASLITVWTRGITMRNVTLPRAQPFYIDEITFTNETVPACLTALCARVGAYWYLDYQNDLHVFTSELPNAYPITDADARTSRNHQLSEDLSQVATRVIGRGGGVGAAVETAPGATDLPVEEGSEEIWYATGGGLVEVGTQVLSYTGVRGRGGKGAFVGTGNAPSAAPSPQPYAGSSHIIGATYGYAATFVTAAGETLPGPLGSIRITTINPVAPPAVSARGRPAGSYPPGMISPGANAFRFAVQIQYRDGAWGPLGAQSALYAWDGNDWEVYIGPKSYYTHSDGSSAFYYPVLEPGGPAAPTNSVQVYRIDNAGGVGWMAISSDYFMGYGASAGWVYQCACSYMGSSYVFPPSGYGSVIVRDVPVSKAAGVTQRKLYRTTANGAALKFLGAIANNSDTSFLDDTADAALGAAPPAGDTSGIKDEGQVLPGATSLPVSSTVPFTEDATPTTAGWVRVGTLPVRYSGIGAGVLTGVPATGVGSITAAIRYGTQVLVQPRLVGIPAGGTVGAIAQPIQRGDMVTIRIERQDDAAVAVMADRLKPPGTAAVSADGVIEIVISDGRWSLTELAAQIAATLTERKDPRRVLTFESRDPSLEVGRLITVTLTKPPISGTFRIQRVSFSEIAISGARGTVHPLRRIEATNKLYTFADLLRQLRGREGGVG